jgi:hypothetical protein
VNRTDLRAGTLYAVAVQSWLDPDRAVLLSAHPHRLTTGHLGGAIGGMRTLRPDPQGRGYGRIRGTLEVQCERGLPALVAARAVANIADEELARLAAALLASGICGYNLASNARGFPIGVSVQVLRPQDVRGTWGDWNARAGHVRAARADRAAQQARADAEALAARGRVLARLRALGVTAEIPDAKASFTGLPVTGQIPWTTLEEIILGVEIAAETPAGGTP